MESIHHQIDKLLTSSNNDHSMENFEHIYNNYAYDQWLEPDTLSSVINYIARKRPDLFDVIVRLNIQCNSYLRVLNLYGSTVQYNHYATQMGIFSR
jgi:hypothetical protein